MAPPEPSATERRRRREFPGWIALGLAVVLAMLIPLKLAAGGSSAAGADRAAPPRRTGSPGERHRTPAARSATLRRRDERRRSRSATPQAPT
ncbi:MAG: hypothetical protein M0014_12885, partial [Actinomycetota bacterium]|nr:hypothetical protein [Actinomycetota bacterium]